MAGIYIHIPFCKHRCTYCDFFSTTQFDQINRLSDSIIREIDLRSEYLHTKSIKTIYFGGGTPSMLPVDDIKRILSKIQSIYNVDKNAELTLEANPDDLNIEILESYLKIGINRLSIGTQSFNDNDLKFMNRRHSAQQAIDAVKAAQCVGFKNISIDLIYGLPNLKKNQWIDSIKQVLELNIQHISAYHLTYHQGTVMWEQLRKGMFKELPDEESVEQFKELVSRLEDNGFQQYEVSNFAAPNFESKHNSSYWFQEEYIGFGPSAHSYNSETRTWNVSHLRKYLDGIEKSIPAIETETLSLEDRYNDYIITRLRTKTGISPVDIENLFGERYASHFNQHIKIYIKSSHARYDNGNITLTKDGLFLSDRIMEDLVSIS